MKKVKFLAVVPVAVAAILAAAPAAFAAASLSVSPSSDLKNGQTVTVKGSGYPANLAVYVLECANLQGSNGEGCDLSNLKQVTTSSSGAFTTTLTVKTGTIGNGSCDAGSTCYISAGDAGRQASASTPIKFAGGSSSSGSSDNSGSSGSNSSSNSGSSGTSGTSGTSGSTSAPTAVNAGSGGSADRNGAPVGVIVLAAVGAAAVIGGGVRLARR